MTCKEFQKELPDLILTADAKPGPAAAAHLRTCPPCTEELRSFSETFSMLDTWTAPEPSPYFDQKMHVRLREEQAAPRMGWFEALKSRWLFNTGHQLRPAMVGALALALVASGGGLLSYDLAARPAQPPQTSHTVEDLKILDNNAQAFEQLDQLQQDEDAPNVQSPGDAGGPNT